MKTKDKIFNRAFDLISVNSEFTIERLKDVKSLNEFNDVFKKIQYLELLKWKRKYENSDNPYQLYDDDSYLITSLGLYKLLSKNYINNIKFIFDEYSDLFKYKTNVKILDFGAGIGLTTLYLAQMYPDHMVYYYNISEKQTNIFVRLLSYFPDINNISIINDYSLLKNIDINMVLLFDVIEHIKEPLNEMINVLGLNPNFIIQGGGFGNLKIAGHFSIYHENFTPRETHLKIKELYKDKGYIDFNSYTGLKETYKFWNNEPKIYYKK